jgi:hypothetical protein
MKITREKGFGKIYDPVKFIKINTDRGKYTRRGGSIQGLRGGGSQRGLKRGTDVWAINFSVRKFFGFFNELEFKF